VLHGVAPQKGKTEVAKKLSKKKLAELLIAKRVQRSVVGFLIPMTSIPALYKAQEAAIAEGKSDEELQAFVAAFPGVIPS
jgi:hypothetical protein